MQISFLFSILFAFIFLSLSSISGFVFAQPSLEVSGIVSGRDPVAIVDGEMIRKGMSVQGFVVQEIGDDFVTFHSPLGELLTRRVGEKIEDGSIGVEAAASPSASVAADDHSDGESEGRFHQAASYASQAERLLTNSQAPNVAAFKEAVDLFDKAERELRFALENASNDDAHEKIRGGIDKIRTDRNNAAESRRDLETRIATAVKNNKVIMGMTADDVTKSIGKPATVNKGEKDGFMIEQWVYVDPLRRAIYLYFQDGILATYQYP